jgi:hypothetical protein
MRRAAQPERHHYTDAAHKSVPVASNTDPASRKGKTPARVGWERPLNTNTQLRRGGISSYHKPREGKGYGLISPTGAARTIY